MSKVYKDFTFIASKQMFDQSNFLIFIVESSVVTLFLDVFEEKNIYLNLKVSILLKNKRLPVKTFDETI